MSAVRSPNPLLFQLKKKNKKKIKELEELRNITWTIPTKGNMTYSAKYLHLPYNTLGGKNIWHSA